MSGLLPLPGFLSLSLLFLPRHFALPSSVPVAGTQVGIQQRSLVPKCLIRWNCLRCPLRNRSFSPASRPRPAPRPRGDVPPPTPAPRAPAPRGAPSHPAASARADRALGGRQHRRVGCVRHRAALLPQAGRAGGALVHSGPPPCSGRRPHQRHRSHDAAADRLGPAAGLRRHFLQPRPLDHRHHHVRRRGRHVGRPARPLRQLPAGRQHRRHQRVGRRAAHPLRGEQLGALEPGGALAPGTGAAEAAAGRRRREHSRRRRGRRRCRSARLHWRRLPNHRLPQALPSDRPPLEDVPARRHVRPRLRHQLRGSHPGHRQHPRRRGRQPVADSHLSGAVHR